MSERESVTGKWGYSHDGEFYQGFFDTPEEAAREGMDEYQAVRVGQFREPKPAEDAIDDWFIENLVEWVCERLEEDYCFDFCSDWPDCTKGQREELAADFRKAFGDWLDRHNLRPTWGVIDFQSVRTVTRDELTAAAERGEG